MSEKAHKPKLKSAIAIALTAICVCAVLIGVGVSPLWAAQSGVVPETGLLENNITVEVEGTIIHYQKQSFWNESEFSAILKNKEEFKTSMIENFKKELSTYRERDEQAVNAEVVFDEERKSTILTCDIQGAMLRSGYFTFRWLLDPFKLDFIDDKFKESKEGLSWDGEVDGIPTNISIKLPSQKTVYAAWEQPVGHCHAHVWWTMPVPSPAPVVTPAPSPSPSPAVSPTSTPAPPGFEAIFAIIGILAVVYLVLRKRSRR